MAEAPRIPVVMYHTVGVRLDSWLWPELTISPELFERQIRLLKTNGYRSLSLDELRMRQENAGSDLTREVVLTFDDGYLDNWVYAYPLLKREGWRGTIYVNPEFVDPGEEPRPNLEDVWHGRCRLEDLTNHGFLNRAELRLLSESGVMDIGSHSMSHTWYPTSAEVVDYHRPGLATPWLAWNARPDRKFAYLTEDQSQFVAFGHPIHTHGRSLGIRRYLPAPELSSRSIEWVAEHGGVSAFELPDWRRRLTEATALVPTTGRLETDDEMMARFRAEVFDSKSALEHLLAAPVSHFCWPGGAYCEASWPLAAEAGFQTICVARKDKTRWMADDASLVRRIGSNDFVTFRGKRYATTDPRFLLWACEVERGVDWKKWPLRWQKAIVAARS